MPQSTPVNAEAIIAEVLSCLAAHEPMLVRFFNLTGLTLGTIREAATDPGSYGSVHPQIWKVNRKGLDEAQQYKGSEHKPWFTRRRQRFKAEVGLGLRETPLDLSICAQAILQPELLIVPDVAQDPRSSGNPLVTGEPHLRFYAGALLATLDGLPLGTLCVLDHIPRDLTGQQAFALTNLAEQVMAQLELRRAVAERDEVLAVSRRTEQRQALLVRELHHRVRNTRRPSKRSLEPGLGISRARHHPLLHSDRRLPGRRQAEQTRTFYQGCSQLGA